MSRQFAEIDAPAARMVPLLVVLLVGLGGLTVSCRRGGFGPMSTDDWESAGVTFCDDQRDCAHGFFCAYGHCRPPCESDSQCPPNSICVTTPQGVQPMPVDAVCTVPGTESSCQVNGCPDGLFCRTDGFCHRGCDNDTSCTSQQECVGGWCISLTTDGKEGGAESGPPGSFQDGSPIADSGQNGTPGNVDSDHSEPPESGFEPEDTGTGGSPVSMDEREWALVRAGRTFYMGSPNNERGRYSQEVRHPVVLTRNYWIMRTEITQSQFGQMMGYNPSHERNCSNCPVEQVRWSELAAYANARSANAGLQACYECFGSGHTGVDCIPSRRYASPYACPGFRLPTEAEWEYAARAGDTRATYNGALDVLTCDPSATLNGIAWYCGNSGSRAHPVGQKRANAWGLSDMLGNVQEWCHDWLGDYPSPSRTATNPTGPNNGQERVLRGGSWGRIPRRTRAAYRYSHEPDDAYNQAGGRLVRTVP